MLSRLKLEKKRVIATFAFVHMRSGIRPKPAPDGCRNISIQAQRGDVMAVPGAEFPLLALPDL
jgi:hypothetical protein